MTISTPRSRLFVVSLGCLLAACSSGDGGPAPGAGDDVTESLLLVDTGVSSTQIAGARVDALAFERADGTFTDNLLANAREIEWARPDAATRSLTLKRAPSGQFIAARLLLGSGSAWVERAGERTPLDLTTTDLKVAFVEPVDFSVGEVPQIALRHSLDSTPPEVGTPWAPRLVGEVVARAALRLARATVQSVDPGGDPAVTITLDRLFDRTVALSFDDKALLQREPTLDPLSVTDFVAGLAVGHRLLVEGDLVGFRAVEADAAVDLGPVDAQGNRGRMHGTIDTVESDGDRIAVVWDRIGLGRDLLPDPLPKRFAVGAKEARIRWVPRHGRPSDLLEEEDLRVGMTVVVHWEGVAGDPLVATRIDIRSELQAPGRLVVGEVTSIDRDGATFAVRVPDRRPGGGGDPLTVEVLPRTGFVDGNGGRILGFEDLQPGGEVRVRGRGASREKLRATLVEITSG